VTNIEVQAALQRAANAAGCTIEDILGRSRRQPIAWARQAVAAYLLMRGDTTIMAGEKLNRDRTTASDGRDKVHEAFADPERHPLLHQIASEVFALADTMTNPFFLSLCHAEGLPKPQEEYRFHPERKWRLDYCWPEHKLALEVEGGVWVRGRHTRGSGFVKDMEKYNAWAIMGGRLLRVLPDSLATGATLDMIRDAIAYTED